MVTPLIPQEIYLLERFCSIERFGELRDSWRAMIDVGENLMARYMRQLSHDLRSRPSFMQPDLVWDQHVFVNLRSIMRELDEAYIKRAAGDHSFLSRALGVTQAMHVVNTEYDSSWMNEVETGGQGKFFTLLYEAERLAWPITITTSGVWGPGELTLEYAEIVKEPLNPPASWPVYRLNPKVRMRSGDRTPQTGIYLPDVDNSFPTLHLKSDDELAGEANEAKVLGGYLPCTWTLIERVADSGGGVPGEDEVSSADSSEHLRCPAGQPCPKAGYWSTPGKSDSRRHFNQGDVMPDLGSAYGATIWQWDASQS